MVPEKDIETEEGIIDDFGQKIAQNKNYICHASYLTNSVVYDHDF